MAVKFSEFTEETVASNITGIVGYVASSNLNVRIAPGALNTSYDLTATDNAANNVPLVLTGSDSTADTVNFVGAGGIQLSSTGNVVTVTSDARVDSFTSSFGNYISGTNQVDATGSVSIGSVNLSAIDGTSDSTTRFLSKDNTWDLVDRGVTGSGTANIVPLWTDTTVLGDSVIAQSNTGNVGIGTTSPSAKLHVVGNTGGVDVTTRFEPQNNNAKSILYLSNQSSGDGGYYYDSSNNLSGLFAYGDYTFNVGTSNIGGTIGDPRMVIKQGGNVGIGTTTPADKLSISSSINQIGLDSGDIATYGTLDLGMFTNGAFIGTQAGSNTQSDLLRFGTSGTERMRITSTGNVGIGTNSPASLLHIKNAFTEANSTSQFKIQNITTDESAVMAFEAVAANSGTGNQGSITFSAGAGGAIPDNVLGFNADNQLSAGIPDMVILGSGNVGIGTTTPGVKLEVIGSVTSGIRLKSTTGASNGFNIYNNSASDTAVLSNFYSGPMVFETTDTEQMRIDNNGNVGIGTTTPDTKVEILSTASSTDRTIPHNVLTITGESGNLPYTGFGGGINFKNRVYNYGLLNSARIRSYIDADSSSNNGAGLAFDVTNSAQTYATSLFLKYNGNVGIGTTTPSEKLTINAPNNTTAVGIDFPSANFDFSANSTSGYTTLFKMDDSGLDIGHNATSRTLNLKTGSLDRLTISGNGQVKFNAYISGTFDGTAAANLAVDSSGNIITEAAGGLAVAEVAAGATVAAAASTLYVFTASSGSVSTLTLPASPTVGDTIKISNIGGLANIVGANTNNIMGVGTDLTIDVATSSFELIWTGISATGWVILSNV